MDVNLNRNLRLILYIVTAIGAPVIAYLNATGVIGENEITLWAGLTTVVAAIAGFNITPTKKVE